MGAFTHEQKVRIKIQLGYPGYGPLGSVVGGLPVVRSSAFMIDARLSTLTDDTTIALVLKYLQKAEEEECKISGSSDELSAAAVGNIQLRGTNRGERVTDLHEAENVRWCMRIADILCVPVYPFADKFKTVGGGPGSMIKMRH